MKQSVTVEESFEMAHRLSTAFTKECNDTVHGHTFTYSFTLSSCEPTCKEIPMLVDFKILKQSVQSVLNKFDHTCLLPTEYKKQARSMGYKTLISPFDPTAENLVQVITLAVLRGLSTRTAISTVSTVTGVLWETPKSYASIEYSEEETAQIVSDRRDFVEIVSSFPIVCCSEIEKFVLLVECARF